MPASGGLVVLLRFGILHPERERLRVRRPAEEDVGVAGAAHLELAGVVAVRLLLLVVREFPGHAVRVQQVQDDQPLRHLGHVKRSRTSIPAVHGTCSRRSTPWCASWPGNRPEAAGPRPETENAEVQAHRDPQLRRLRATGGRAVDGSGPPADGHPRRERIGQDDLPARRPVGNVRREGAARSKPELYSVHPAWWRPNKEGIQTTVTIELETGGSDRHDPAAGSRKDAYLLSRSVTTVGRDAARNDEPDFERRHEMPSLMKRVDSGAWEPANVGVAAAVQQLLPWDPRDFFVMDADQAADFVGGTENRQISVHEVERKTTGAVRSLLGIDVFEAAADRLRKAARNFGSEATRAVKNHQLDELQGEQDRLEDRVEQGGSTKRPLTIGQRGRPRTGPNARNGSPPTSRARALRQTKPAWSFGMRPRRGRPATSSRTPRP